MAAKVASYVKNLGKSISFSTIDVLKENSEGLSNFLEESSNITKQVYASIKDIRKKNTSLKDNKIYDAVDSTLRNFVKSVKTGDFYNKSIDNEIAKEFMGEDFMSDLDFSDFDDDVDFDEEIHSKTNTDSVERAIGAAATVNTTAVAQSTDLIIRSNRASNKSILNQMEILNTSISSNIGALYNQASTTNEFIKGPLTAHLDNSKKYYESMTKMMQEQVAMMKEFIETTGRIYGNDKSKNSYGSSKLNQSINSDGSINIEGYIKNIKSNIDNSMFGMVFNLADMLSGGNEDGNGIKILLNSAQRIGLNWLVENKLIGKKFSKSINSFDKGISSLFANFISRANSRMDDYSNEVLQALAEFFGVSIDKKDSINTGNYKKTAIPFDGITKKAITEVIPGYLARIEAALTGKSKKAERYFDYEAGRWNTLENIEDEFKKERARAISSTGSSIKEDLTPLIDELRSKNAQDAKQFEKFLNKMFTRIFEDGGEFKPEIVDPDTMISGGKAWERYGARSKEEFDMALKNMSKSSIRRTTYNAMQARENLTKRLENLENNGSIYDILFNQQLENVKTDDETWKSYGAKSKEEFELALSHVLNSSTSNIGVGQSKYMQKLIKRIERDQSIFDKIFSENKDGSKASVIKAGGVGILASSRDETGKNIFYYLKEILNSISSYRRNKKSKPRPKNYRPNASTTTTSTTSTEDSTSSDFDDDSEDEEENLFNTFAAVEEEERKKKEEELKRNPNKWKKLIREKFGETRLGKWISKKTKTETEDLIQGPFGYMANLLDKADNALFKMIFGENSYKDDKGNPIDNVFDYIIYKIKTSFKELSDWLKEKVFSPIEDRLKKFYDDKIKPKWNEYVKPTLDEAGIYARYGFNRAKEAFGNTFGKGFNKIKNNLRKGGVVNSNDKKDPGEDEIKESAEGRIVTKRGLTMISPGEVIIPASFDKKKQKKDLLEEKKEKARLEKEYGDLGYIPFNAEGNMTKEEIKTIIDEILATGKDTIKYNAPKIGAGGLIGGGASLIAGINPIIGALVGATTSFVQHSSATKDLLFGKVEDGKRSGKGVIPKNVLQIFEKYGSDMLDFGIAGGIFGLVSPLGILGTAAVGAGVGFLKNNDKFKKFVFGDLEEGRDGLISKESFEKFKDKLGKNKGKILAGAGLGILGGPFGLLGNAVLGAVAGLATTTELFHTTVFGDGTDDNKGIVGAIQEGIIEPAKAKGKAIIADLNEFLKTKIASPFEEFAKVITQDIRNIIADIGDGIKDGFNNMINSYIGAPLRDFLLQRVFKPVTKTLGFILKGPYALAKGAISLPFKMLGGIGKMRRASQIGKGKAYDLSASERIGFRNENKKNRFGFGILKGFGIDKTLRQDEILANMSQQELSTLNEYAKGIQGSREDIEGEYSKSVNDVKSRISGYMNTETGEGRNLYDKIGWKKTQKIYDAISNGNIEEYNRLIKGSGLSNEEQSALKEKLGDSLDVLSSSKSKKDALDLNTDIADSKLSEIIGNKNIKSKKYNRQLRKLLESELKARGRIEAASELKIAEEESNKDPAEKIVDSTDKITEAIREKSNELLEVFKMSNAYLKSIATGDKSSIEEIENENANATSPVKDAINTVLNTGENKENKDDNPNNEDSKEFRDKEKEEKEAAEDEKEELEHTKTAAEVLSDLRDKLFGDKDGKKRHGGFLGKIGEGFGKVLKFLGITGAVFTGISASGYASEWFQTSIWPTIKKGLFGTKNEDGTTTGGVVPTIGKFLLGDKATGEPGVVGKITGWLGDKIKDIGNWFQKDFPSFLSEKVLPVFINGIGLAAENIVVPLTEALLVATPKIVGGVVKGLWNYISGKTKDKYGDTSSSKVGDGETKINEETAKDYNLSVSENGELVTEDGTVVKNTGFTRDDTTILDKVTGAVGRNFMKTAGGLTTNTSPWFTRKLSKIGINGFKKIPTSVPGAVVGLTKTGVKAGLKTTASAVNASGKLGTRVADKINAANDGLKNMIKSARGVDIIDQQELINNRISAADDLVTKINENSLGTRIKSFLFGQPDNAAKATKNAAKAAKKQNFISKGISSLKEGASKLKDNIVTKAVEGSKNIVNKMSNTKFVSKITNTVSDNTKTFKEGLQKIFEKMANSKVGDKILSVMGFGETLRGKLTKALLNVAEDLSTKALGKGGAKVAAKLVGVVAKFNPLGLAMLIYDFLEGFNNAATILGVAKDDYIVGNGEKIICGLLNVITANFTLGLIDPGVIVDIIMDHILPLLGYDDTTLQLARDNADDVLAKWNAEHPDEQYESLEEYNKKDKWTTKVKKTFKSFWDKITNKVKGNGRDSESGSGRKDILTDKFKEKKLAGGARHNYQKNNAISKIPYGDSTIGESGCAPVAASNVVNRIRNNGYSSVADAAKFAEANRMTVPGGGTDINYFNSYFNSKGIPSYSTSNRSDIMNAIKSGNQVVMLGKDSTSSKNAPFGTNPHYITAVGTDSRGNIIAEDPDLPQSTVTYSKNKVLSSMIKSVVTGRGGRGRGNNATRKYLRRLSGRGRGTVGPEAILNIAWSQVGTISKGSNDVVYNDVFYGYHATGENYKWCCVFVWWVFNQAGAGHLLPIKTGRCRDLLSAFQSKGQTVKYEELQPGDIAFMNFDGGTTAYHVGIVTGIDDKGNVCTIDGNTTMDDGTGNWGVQYKARSRKYFVGYARPDYPYEYDDSNIVDMTKYGDSTDYYSMVSNNAAETMDKEMINSSSQMSTVTNPSTAASSAVNAVANTGNNNSIGTTKTINGVPVVSSGISGYVLKSNAQNSTTGSNSKTSKYESIGDIFTLFTTLGKNIFKAWLGEDRYNAFFGGENEDSSVDSSETITDTTYLSMGETNRANGSTANEGSITPTSSNGSVLGSLLSKNTAENNYDGLSEDQLNSIVATNTSSTAAKSGTDAVASTVSTSTPSTTTASSGNTASAVTTPNGNHVLTASDNAKFIWNHLANKGVYTKAGLAGILGNLEQESGFKPANLENTFEYKYGDDATYTKMVDNGSYSKDDFVNQHKCGYGLPGWTWWSLKEGLWDATVGKNKSLGDLEAQTEYLHTNIRDQYPGLFKTLTSTNNYNTAADAMLEQYERPYGFSQNASQTGWSTDPDHIAARNREYNTRRGNAQRAYTTYAGEGRNSGISVSKALSGGASRTANAGLATESISMNTSETPTMTPAAHTATNSTIDYTTFLETIVEVLLSIADNTAMLSKIINILSENFNIKVDASDISSARDQARSTAKQNLNDLIKRTNGNNIHASNLLENRDTTSIIAQMVALARE